MIAADVTFTIDQLLVIVGPAATAIVAWATYITKMIWDIRVATNIKNVEQDAAIAELRHDVSELHDLLPRHIPNP